MFLKKHRRQNRQAQRPRSGDEIRHECVLKAQLKDNKIRHRLLNLIPGIVQGLVVDTANRRYQIMALDGQVSDWRKV